VSESELEEALKNNGKVFVLFYASWCPFSKKFLPVYERYAKNSRLPCIRVVADDKFDLCIKYEIEVFPTVLLFENGAVAERLDGEPGAGLEERQLRKMLSAH
jgi:thiol-disulfide isomerase/thioredoxin